MSAPTLAFANRRRPPREELPPIAYKAAAVHVRFPDLARRIEKMIDLAFALSGAPVTPAQRAPRNIGKPVIDIGGDGEGA